MSSGPSKAKVVLATSGSREHTTPLRFQEVLEIVSDSEDERTPLPSRVNGRKAKITTDEEVIVISSDDEYQAPIPSTNRISKKDTASSKAPTCFNKPKTPRRVRRIVQSSDESDNAPAAGLNITDSSSSDEAAKERAIHPQPSLSRIVGTSTAKIDFSAVVNGGEVLVWDAPRSPRKPIRTPTNIGVATTPSTPKRGKTTTAAGKGKGKEEDAPSTGRSSPTKKTRPASQKAIAEAKQQRLAEYAQSLFTDLNRVVFNNGLPADVELKWSKTLRVTAGRASYSRNRKGEITAKIDLAVKVLDSEERILLTMAHEMCHLACWIINKKHNENHGALFKDWAARVEYERPDIHVSTTHDYEIAYKFEWQCEVCDLVYGRHSKSIKPKDVCGRCHKGYLKPLFVQRTRKAPQTPKTSRMAPSKSQDSPLRRTPLKGASEDLEVSVCSVEYDESAADSDDEVEVLATILAGADLGDS
ncbi:SprT-like family-domain-containing protein [Mucidula mucida]|nr:SprT-like family-domain-containing protein [Mucidula mucida]